MKKKWICLFLFLSVLCFAKRVEIDEVKLLYVAKTNLPSKGTLQIADNGFVYLDVEDQYIHFLAPLIPNAKKPKYFCPGAIGAHITVLTSTEYDWIRPLNIEEIGQEFPFEITGVSQLPWKDASQLVFLDIHCPDLEKLRDKYVWMADKLGDFHITIGQVFDSTQDLVKNSDLSDTVEKVGENMSRSVTQAMVQSFKKDFHKYPELRVARNAIAKVGFEEAAIRQEYFTSLDHTYSIHLKDETKITNQMKSGRCWLFAGLNSMRLSLMKKYNLENFEFSQSYMFFWDKLEKANYFLESIIKTRDEDVHGRLVSHILKDPVCDGGQWDMFVNLVEKYGVIPKSAMRETFHSGNSPHLNFMLSHKLREFAMVLRDKMPKKTSEIKLFELKSEMLNEIYRILVVHLGEPPQKFDWCFRDKKKKHYAFRGLTPQEFVKKHVSYNVEDKVSIIHAPTKDKPYGSTFTVDYLGNIVGGRDLLYLNLPVEDLKKYAIQTLKDHEPVWFGCDVGKFFNRQLGVMDLNLYDYPLVFNTTLEMNKAERLDYGDSVLTHAMVLTGVDLDRNKPLKWRVENSWGKELGDEGYFLMSDAWFDEYLYEIVVDKKILSEKHQKCLEKEPIRLDPWDPFGSLAN